MFSSWQENKTPLVPSCHTFACLRSPSQTATRFLVTSRLPMFSYFFQTRLYAAQAARKVEFTGAAEHVKFQPQDVQVSGCWFVFLLLKLTLIYCPWNGNDISTCVLSRWLDCPADWWSPPWRTTPQPPRSECLSRPVVAMRRLTTRGSPTSSGWPPTWYDDAAQPATVSKVLFIPNAEWS